MDERTRRLERRWKETQDHADLDRLASHVGRIAGKCLHRTLSATEFDGNEFGARVRCQTCDQIWWAKYHYPNLVDHSLQGVSKWNADGASEVWLRVFVHQPTTTGVSLVLHWEGKCIPWLKSQE